jgi:uncharacterized protein (TIGR03435 family)
MVKEDAGKISYVNVTLRDLIEKSLDLRRDQISSAGWVSSQRYDITAKFDPAISKGEIPELLASLLKERFQLKFHWDKKVMDIYALVSVKEGSKLHATAEQDGIRISRGPQGYQITGSATLKRLAELMGHTADRPVFDMTGQTGPFAIKLTWVPDSVRASPQDAPVSPSDGPTIFTALREQLGLQLRPTKTEVKLLVVDGVNRTPTEN